jgi:hypothetical protein
MSHDTRHLVESVGTASFAYREIAAEEEQAAAAARWPLLASINRTLAIGARPSRSIPREEPATPRLVVRSAATEGR